MNYLEKIIESIELHSVEGIEECFQAGVSPNALHNNELLIFELISEYTRTSRFKDCVKVFVKHGLQFDDAVLLNVLLDKSDELKSLLNANPELINKRYSLRCAYTPLYEVSLLHVCAEFNLVNCAKVLLNNGIDVNVKAGEDQLGFGNQTPIFHTVNQNSNNSKEMLDLLLDYGADLNYTVRGLIWGKDYQWETFIPSVNPISYAMMGLLPQMHRDEKTIANIVSQLTKAAYGIDYTSVNIPNRYLN